MKNIYILPTDKQSKLCYDKHNNLVFDSNARFVKPDNKQHIYITSDEEIKDKCYVLSEISIGPLYLDGVVNTASMLVEGKWKKIILTTDPELIEDGVQAIDDEFLEWFVQNPSCESVEVNDWLDDNGNIAFGGDMRYQIIIPKEEPKPIHQQIIDLVGGIERCKELLGIKPNQETPEEAAEKYANFTDEDMFQEFLKTKQ